MNINEVHWNFSDNGTKEPAKGRFWNFYNFWTAWKFLMRFSLFCSGEWALSFNICVFIYIGVSLTYFRAMSNLVPYAFVWEKGKTMDFLETIVVYDIKVGRRS